MNIRTHPVGATLLLGLLGACGWLLLFGTSPFHASYPITLRLYLWGLLMLYSLFLSHLGGQRCQGVLFPLALCLVAAITNRDQVGFLVHLVLCLAWIRSHLSFGFSIPKTLIVEGILGAGGMLLVGLLAMGSTYAWCLGIWMFFLIQGLFHLWADHHGRRGRRTESRADPFETARCAADKILNDLDSPPVL